MRTQWYSSLCTHGYIYLLVSSLFFKPSLVHISWFLCFFPSIKVLDPGFINANLSENRLIFEVNFSWMVWVTFHSNDVPAGQEIEKRKVYCTHGKLFHVSHNLEDLLFSIIWCSNVQISSLFYLFQQMQVHTFQSDWKKNFSPLLKVSLLVPSVSSASSSASMMMMVFSPLVFRYDCWVTGVIGPRQDCGCVAG